MLPLECSRWRLVGFWEVSDSLVIPLTLSSAAALTRSQAFVVIPWEISLPVWCRVWSHSKQNNICPNNTWSCLCVVYGLNTIVESSRCIWSRFSDTWMIEWRRILCKLQNFAKTLVCIRSFMLLKIACKEYRGFLWCSECSLYGESEIVSECWLWWSHLDQSVCLSLWSLILRPAPHRLLGVTNDGIRNWTLGQHHVGFLGRIFKS